MHKGYQVLLLLIWLGFCAVLFNFWPTSSSEWASWVQAIGSIGAIVAAFLVVNFQRAGEAKSRQLQKLEQLHALNEILLACESRLHQIDGRLHDGRVALSVRLSFCARWEASLRAVYKALSAVPFHETPFASTCSNGLAAIYHLERCLGILSELSHLNASEMNDQVKGRGLIERFRFKRVEFRLECRRIRSAVRQYERQKSALRSNAG